MTKAKIEQLITDRFIESAELGRFNGVPASSLVAFAGSEANVRSILKKLVADKAINCAFSSVSINPHIKRLPDLPIEDQIALLDTESIGGICAYPSKENIESRVDLNTKNTTPFSRELYAGNAQLEFVGFDMAVLERYRNDPRYTIKFNDYMGFMSISDEAFEDSEFPERDKILVQTFGLGFDAARRPVVVVFLRYLAGLTPEHQQYWNSFKINGEARLSRPYYESAVLGQIWKNRSVRHAIFEELRAINRMTIAIWGSEIFRSIPEEGGAIDLASFLRPTRDNFERFVLALDKLLSENINVTFFEGKVKLEEEIRRADGKIEVRRKGSLALLAELLFAGKIKWSDAAKARDVIMGPLRAVRRGRQKPAHKLTSDHFADEYYKERRTMLWDVLNSLANIRGALSTHPAARDVVVPDWLDEDAVDVF